MAILVKFTAPGVTRELYETVRKDIGWDNAPPAGCLLHTAHFDADGVHTMDLWESDAALQSYVAHRFNPACARAGLPAAVVSGVDVPVIAASPAIEAYLVRTPAVG